MNVSRTLIIKNVLISEFKDITEDHPNVTVEFRRYSPFERLVILTGDEYKIEVLELIIKKAQSLGVE